MTNLPDCPADLLAVLAAIGEAMGAGRLSPEVLKRVPTERGAIVAGHELRLEHLPKGLAARYLVAIDGERWKGAVWTFRSGELERLARETRARQARD